MTAQIMFPSRRYYNSASCSTSSARTHHHHAHHWHSALSSSSIGGTNSGGCRGSSLSWYPTPPQANSLESTTILTPGSSAHHYYQQNPPKMTTAPITESKQSQTCHIKQNDPPSTTAKNYPLPPPPQTMNPGIFQHQHQHQHYCAHPSAAAHHQHQGSQKYHCYQYYQHHHNPYTPVNHIGSHRPPHQQQNYSALKHNSNNKDVCRPSYYDVATMSTPATGQYNHSRHEQPLPSHLLQSPPNVKSGITVTDEKKAVSETAVLTVVATAGSCGRTGSCGARTVSCSISSVSSNPETATIKTPISLCFERMLGAADLIATVPRESSKASMMTDEEVEEGGEVLFHDSDDDSNNMKPRAKRKISMTSQDDDNHSNIIVTTTNNRNNNKAPSMLPLKKRKGIVMSADQGATAHNIELNNQQELIERLSPSATSVGRLLEVSPRAVNTTSVDDQIRQESNNNPFREIERDPNLYKKVVVKMALQRQVVAGNKNNGNGVGHDNQQDGNKIIPSDATTATNVVIVIPDGFFWRDFPKCEQVLYDNMVDYYMLSSGQRQSKLQHAFNNRLVLTIRETAAASGLKFDDSFNDKKLRDRIRCFFKTHLQNAKKRLVTLQKHPEWEENQVALRVYIRAARDGISVEEARSREPKLVQKKKKKKRSKSNQRNSNINGSGKQNHSDLLTQQQNQHQGGGSFVAALRLPTTTLQQGKNMAANQHGIATASSSILSDLDRTNHHHDIGCGGNGLLLHKNEQFSSAGSFSSLSASSLSTSNAQDY